MPAIDGFAIDLDGVVWLSREPITGSIEALGRLRRSGRPLVFVTNDPRSTRSELAARLTELGAATGPGEILTSATATATALAEAHPGARALAIGTESLARELADRGIDVIGQEASRDGVGPRDIEAVVVGGGAGFDYELLRVAAGIVREGAGLWATNKDPTYPTAGGLVPGTGAIVAAIEVASGSVARNVGKPEPGLFREALAGLGVERALMAGDSLTSDIAGAAAAGMTTALLLTGRDGREDVAAAPVAPDLVFDDLAALADAFG
jgi:HAD superfamily hydrolase (TIGR01450 family)